MLPLFDVIIYSGLESIHLMSAHNVKGPSNPVPVLLMLDVIVVDCSQRVIHVRLVVFMFPTVPELEGDEWCTELLEGPLPLDVSVFHQ